MNFWTRNKTLLLQLLTIAAQIGTWGTPLLENHQDWKPVVSVIAGVATLILHNVASVTNPDGSPATSAYRPDGPGQAAK